jgi:hypothetical protein
MIFYYSVRLVMNSNLEDCLIQSKFPTCNHVTIPISTNMSGQNPVGRRNLTMLALAPLDQWVCVIDAIVKMSENDENNENVMEIIAKMVGPRQPTEGGVGMNLESTGRARKEWGCPGMMSVRSREVGYTRSDGDMVANCDICVRNGKRWLVACNIVTESAASDATC